MKIPLICLIGMEFDAIDSNHPTMVLHAQTVRLSSKAVRASVLSAISLSCTMPSVASSIRHREKFKSPSRERPFSTGCVVVRTLPLVKKIR